MAQMDEMLVDDKSKQYISHSIYNLKLTPLRKDLIELILKNLDEGILSWHRGWKLRGAPMSAITGKSYKGVNNIYLTLIAMERGYKDNRWLTFNQMKKNNYRFKQEEGSNYSLGHGAGVTIEFFTLYDNNTKKPFDDKNPSYAKLDEDLKLAYVEKHVKPVRQFATVYNADLVEGLEPLEEETFSTSNKIPKAESFIKYWDLHEAHIEYGGDESAYIFKKDQICMPYRNSFESQNEFYSTLFHEIAHSTGHESRLNRNLCGKFGTAQYAIEELRAEIASVFIEQEMGVYIGEKDLKNNSAYIQSWKSVLTFDPNALFRAIADAQKIADFVESRSRDYIKNDEKQEVKYSYQEQLMMDDAILQDIDVAVRKEPYAKIKNEQGLYQIGIVSSYGDTALFNNGETAKDENEFNAMLKRMINIDSLGGATYKEVTPLQLKAISIDRAKRATLAKVEGLDVKPSDYFNMPPRKVDMTGKGLDSLKYMSDRETVENAFTALGGETFKTLYFGDSVYQHEDRDERALMYRIASKTQNLDQILRIFESSGQFREGKNQEYAELALEAQHFIKALDEEKNKVLPKKAREKIKQSQKVRG